MPKLYLIFVTLFSLLSAAQGAMAASISITPSGNGSFIVYGNGMDGIYGIELKVVYDAASMASPSVSQGSLVSAGVMAANTNNPGSIRVAIINTSPFSGSGQIATISFATHTGTGKVTVTSSMINSKGASLAGGGESVALDFQTTTDTPSGFPSSAGIPFSQPTATTTPSTPVAAVSTSSGPAYLGTISMPSDIQTKASEKPADAVNPPITHVEPPLGNPGKPMTEEKASSGVHPPEKVKMTVYKGIFDNFQTFKGDKSPATLVALFNKQVAPAIRQEPAISLSDGKSPLKIVVELRNAGNKSPNFALSGAKLVSLKIDSASSVWIVEAMPQPGGLQASLTILTDTDIIEYPLTIAPPVDGVSADEAEFVSFLKDSGTKAPKRDLNNDGKHDYLDDFIYTANFLNKKRTAATPAK